MLCSCRHLNSCACLRCAEKQNCEIVVCVYVVGGNTEPAMRVEVGVAGAVCEVGSASTVLQPFSWSMHTERKAGSIQLTVWVGVRVTDAS